MTTTTVVRFFFFFCFFVLFHFIFIFLPLLGVRFVRTLKEANKNQSELKKI